MVEDEDDIPELPQPEAQKEISGLPDAARLCPSCKKPARIVTNQYGTQAYCDACKRDWPVANPGVYPMTGYLPERGIHRVTVIDYSTPQGDVFGRDR